MRTVSLSVVLGLSAAAGLTAQRLVSYDPAVPMQLEHQPPTPIFPGPLPPVLVYPQAPPLPVIPAAGMMFPGDSTFDNVTGLHWYTNGVLVAQQATPSFPPGAPVMPPFPIPPAVLAPIGGMVTGMAIDPIAGILWLCGMPGIVIGVAPVPAMPIVVPPFPMLFPAGPITGLEWDGSSGRLIAVDGLGFVYPFLVGGAAAGPVIAPPLPIGPIAGDVAIDKTMRLNGVGARPLYVVAGGIIYDTNDPFAVPFPSGAPLSAGLAFLDHPAATPPMGGCACPGGASPLNFTTSVMSSGNAAFGLGMTGLMPFSPAIFAFDTAFNPLFPTINLYGCPLGLLGSGLILAVAVADPLGTVTLPLPLLYPVGAGPLYNQNLVPCAADPLGFLLSPMQMIHAAGF